MTLSEVLGLIFAFAGGIGLGVFFFGGLWWTIRHAKTTSKPTLLMVSSFLVRALLIIAGFYLLSGGRWERIILAILGFLVARFVMIRRLSFNDEKGSVRIWN